MGCSHPARRRRKRADLPLRRGEDVRADGRHDGPAAFPAINKGDDGERGDHAKTEHRRALGARRRRVPRSTRPHHPAARLLLGPAAGAVGFDAPAVDEGCRRRSQDHRPVRPGRHALHHQVPVGAAGRCISDPGARPGARPPARLARYSRSSCSSPRCCSSARRIPSPRRGWWRWPPSSSPPLRPPRTSSSMRSAPSICRPRTRRRAWPISSPPIASACWSRPPASSRWLPISNSAASIGV